ncbi:MAG: hypothetical protein K8F91_09065, partial [Candidatus Obscuribacterales bacterium]|nr:hypothetical protein [Candidatus Obscuribacterales bacterium]
MNPFQIIATLRKFGNYLVGLFPIFATISESLAAHFKTISQKPAVKGIIERAGSSNFFQAIWKIVERFYWRDYKKNRLDLSESPPECLPILRPIFQCCALLCILIPFTQFPINQVAIETLSGFKGMAPTWSVVLWSFCLPLAWAVLLSGMALSNRSFFAPVAIAALYFMSSCVLELPRSSANAFLTIAILLNLIYCFKTHNASSLANRIYNGLTLIAVG